MKLSKRVLEMEESVTLASDARAKKLKAEGKDVLFLTLGQPDFHTPENILLPSDHPNPILQNFRIYMFQFS